MTEEELLEAEDRDAELWDDVLLLENDERLLVLFDDVLSDDILSSFNLDDSQG